MKLVAHALQREISSAHQENANGVALLYNNVRYDRLAAHELAAERGVLASIPRPAAGSSGSPSVASPSGSFSVLCFVRSVLDASVEHH